jgi:hypothetical protein
MNSYQNHFWGNKATVVIETVPLNRLYGPLLGYYARRCYFSLAWDIVSGRAIKQRFFFADTLAQATLRGLDLFRHLSLTPSMRNKPKRDWVWIEGRAYVVVSIRNNCCWLAPVPTKQIVDTIFDRIGTTMSANSQAAFSNTAVHHTWKYVFDTGESRNDLKIMDYINPKFYSEHGKRREFNLWKSRTTEKLTHGLHPCFHRNSDGK